MENLKNLQLCIDYIKVVNDMFITKSIIEFDDKRTELHNALMDALQLDSLNSRTITDSLDLWIALPDHPLNDEENKFYGMKLFKLLTSDYLKNSSWGDLLDKLKTLRQQFYDDINFQGYER